MTTSESARSSREFLSRFLVRAWAEGRDLDTARLQLAQRQFDFYADAIKKRESLLSEVAAPPVAQARHYLSQFSGRMRGCIA